MNDPEQELQIVSAELETAQREKHALQLEVDRLNLRLKLAEQGANALIDQARDQGVALTAPELGPKDELALERVELDETRESINNDLQALHELRHGSDPAEPPPETALDIVRANNAERQALQDTARRLTTILGRVAGCLGIDRWDVEGTELVTKLQDLSTLRGKITARLKNARRTGGATHPEIPVLEWFLAQLKCFDEQARLAAFGDDAPANAKIAQPPEPPLQ